MTASVVVLAGMLLAAGFVALVAVPTTPRLSDALDRVGAQVDRTAARHDLGEVLTRSQRLGALTYRHLPIRLRERQQRALRLQGRTLADLYGDKAALALTGALAPLILGFLASALLHLPVYVPPLAAAAGAVAGFWLPDLFLLRESRRARSSAVEGLLMYVDLVTLERLANASASQALHNAAQVSDAPLFAAMRVALERARLEQRSPYAELRRLADDMALPELNDVADVMQLDETGAALSDTLRARVRELRDAHLTAQQMAAAAAAEGMTLYMTLPSLIFGALFIGAALLRIVQS
jgi:tight adherence protein C